MYYAVCCRTERQVSPPSSTPFCAHTHSRGKQDKGYNARVRVCNVLVETGPSNSGEKIPPRSFVAETENSGCGGAWSVGLEEGPGVNNELQVLTCCMMSKRRDRDRGRCDTGKRCSMAEGKVTPLRIKAPFVLEISLTMVDAWAS